MLMAFRKAILVSVVVVHVINKHGSISEYIVNNVIEHMIAKYCLLFSYQFGNFASMTMYVSASCL